MAYVHTAAEVIAMAPLAGENPLPQFRSPAHDIPVSFLPGTPLTCRTNAGKGAGFRMLPYTKQDRYNRNRSERRTDTVVLENECLVAVFLPAWGGRLWSLYDRQAGRELLYHNNVLQPANLAIRNAWFSGGIEWNAGQYGHAFTTCDSVNFVKVAAPDGEEFLRLYQYERCKGFVWQIDFHLPDKSPILYAHAVLYNLSDSAVPMYYWTNIAVPQSEYSRVFASSETVLYTDPSARPGEFRFGYGRLPELASAPGIDLSYPSRSEYANEYFFDCSRSIHPWEAALDRDGCGLFDMSTARLSYRKMFCWGNLAGGRHWGSYLAGNNETGISPVASGGESAQSTYFEIQAGLAPTQLHGVSMPAQTRWSWTQSFGMLAADAADVVSCDWQTARRHVETCVGHSVAAAVLDSCDREYSEKADLVPYEQLSEAGEWGALENIRRSAAGEASLPASCPFNCDRERVEKNPWYVLLEQGFLPSRSPALVPGPFMTGKAWKTMLAESLVHSSGKDAWFSLYHLGVMELEADSPYRAARYWKKADSLCRTAWTLRNLAVLSIRKGDDASALSYYASALEAPGGQTDSAIAEEYVTLLVRLRFYASALDVYRSLPAEWQQNDILLMEYGKIAAATGDRSSALHVLEHNFANIREKECPLTDIWSLIEPADPPFCLDFRML